MYIFPVENGTGMQADSPGIYVMDAGPEFFVRVVGRGTFQNSQPLRQHVTEIIQRDCREFYVDLGGCQGMDSTFLGVLAGFGLSLRRNCQHSRLHILNASDRNLQSLRSLGLDRLMEMHPPAPAHPLPPETGFRKLPGSDANGVTKFFEKKAAAELMLDAHEALCRLDARNEPKFEEVKQTLRDKIANPPPGPEQQN